MKTFGPFTLDPDRRLLSRDGSTTELGQKANALLLALLAARERRSTRLIFWIRSGPVWWSRRAI